MLRDAKLPIIIGSGIPFLSYLAWLFYFSNAYPSLSPDPNNKTILHFVIGTSAIVASISLSCHMAFSMIYVKKLAEYLRKVQELNHRAQALTEDLSEVSNYHQELVQEIVKENDADRGDCAAKAKPSLNQISELAEEISLRVDKAAIEMQNLDSQIARSFRTKFQTKTKNERLWESAYYFR
ncbi:MAG: hypothetical protein J7501_01810 [Bdellovibrio sp.]|nr:hypothetical protein [Bdellovibrio sp.]